MSSFLALKHARDQPPPVVGLLNNIGGDLNVGFYNIASTLFDLKAINPDYTLLSIREIIDASPLNVANWTDPSNMSPTQTFRWAFIVYALEGRSVSENQEMEYERIKYLTEHVFELLLGCDLTNFNFVCFAIAAITLMVRIGKLNVPKIDDSIYSLLLNLLQKSDFPSADPIELSGFSVPNLFSLLIPLNIDQITSNNVFSDIGILLHTAILRLLPLLFAVNLPSMIDDFKTTVAAFCRRPSVEEIAITSLKVLFDNDLSKAYLFSDSIIFKDEIANIQKYSADSDNFKTVLSYEDTVSLSTSLAKMVGISKDRGDIWKEYIKDHVDFLQELEGMLQANLGSHFHCQAAFLLKQSGIELTDIDTPITILISSNDEKLRSIISDLLVQQKPERFSEIHKYFHKVCNCGSRSNVFFKFLQKIMPNLPDKEYFINLLIESLKTEKEACSHLPYAFIYEQLSNYINITASYLDPQPCIVCNNPGQNSNTYTIGDIRCGCKFTDDTLNYQLSTPLLVSSLQLKYQPRKNGRTPRTVVIFVSSADIKDVNDLRSQIPKWRKVYEMNIPKGTTTSLAEFPLPIYTTCLRIRFTEFWEDPDAYGTLNCPMCHKPIPDRRSGMCPRCKENAYQCKECRHINYSNLDGFVCSECGFTPYVSMDWTITATPSFSHTHITTDEDVDASLQKCDDLLAQAHEKFSSLDLLRKQIEECMSPSNTAMIHDRTNNLHNLYNDQCKSTHSSLTSIVQHIIAIRNAVSLYNGRALKMYEISENACYNCHIAYTKSILNFLLEIVDCIPDPSVVTSVLLDFAFSTDLAASTASQVLLSFCKRQSSLFEHLIKMFINQLPTPPPYLIKLICEMLEISDEHRQERLLITSKALVKALTYQKDDPSYVLNVIRPLSTTILSSPIIITDPNVYKMNKIYNAWKTQMNKAKSPLVDPLLLFSDNDEYSLETLCVLAHECSSQTVRQKASALLLSASKLDDKHYKPVFNFIVNLFMESTKYNSKDEQLFSIIPELCSSLDKQVHLIFSGFVDHSIEFFKNELCGIMDSEGLIGVDLSVGYNLFSIVNNINPILEDQMFLHYFVNRKREVIETLIGGFFTLKSLIVQRSKYLDDAMDMLEGLSYCILDPKFVLESTNEEGEEEEDAFANNSQDIVLDIAVRVLERSPDSTIRELYTLLFPPPEIPDIPILTTKYHSQEDYIPGHLSRNVINSHTIGPAMRNIKNKICTDLGMLHMIEDDLSMELLVNDNIISLDLPIHEVYNHIWMPEHGNTPMVVICRLQGLSGEATEPMITSFPSTASDKEDPEVQYAFTECLCKNNGLNTTIHMIPKLKTEMALFNLLELIETFMVIKANRLELIKVDAFSPLYALLEKIVSKGSPMKMMINVMDLIKKLLDEDQLSDEFSSQRIDFIFTALGSPIVHENEDLVSPLLGLIPYYAVRSSELMDQVLSFFMSKLHQVEVENFNYFRNYSSLFVLKGFAEFTLSLPATPEGSIVRNRIYERSIVADAVSYLEDLFVGNYKDLQPVWEENLNNHALQPLLKTLAGMVLQHKPTQELFLANDQQLLKIIFELESIPSASNIGEYATLVVKNALVEPTILDAPLQKLKDDRTNEAKKKAAAQRALIMKQSVPKAFAAMLDDLNDEEWECCICKEGYSYKPKEQLGIYIYADGCSFATHFVCIHPLCHQRNVQTEQKGSHPLSEWEAAAVRNCERPTNCIFPLPSKTLGDGYLNNFSKFITDVTHDNDKFMALSKIVYSSVSRIAGGVPMHVSGKPVGSIQNDLALMAVLMYNGHQLLDREPNLRQQQEQKLQTMINSASNFDVHVFSSSLWLLSLGEWENLFVRIILPFVESRIGSAEDTIKVFKQTITTAILFDRLQHFIKTDNSSTLNVAEDGSVAVPNHSGEPWIVQFVAKAQDGIYGMVEDWRNFSNSISDEVLSIEDPLQMVSLLPPDWT